MFSLIGASNCSRQTPPCPYESEGPHFLLGAAKARICCGGRVSYSIFIGVRQPISCGSASCQPLRMAQLSSRNRPPASLRCEPFQHMIMAPYEVLPYYVEGLLIDEDRRLAMASGAYAFARNAPRSARTLAAHRADLCHVGPKLIRRPSAPAVPALLGGCATRAGQAVPGGCCDRRFQIVPPGTTVGDGFIYPQAAYDEAAFPGQPPARATGERARAPGIGGTPHRSTPRPHGTRRRGRRERRRADPQLRGSYVEECLDSVLASTGLSPEVLVMTTRPPTARWIACANTWNGTRSCRSPT